MRLSECPLTRLNRPKRWPQHRRFLFVLRFLLKLTVIIEELCQRHMHIPRLPKERFILSFQRLSHFLSRTLDSHLVFYSQFFGYALCVGAIWFGVV